MEDIEHLKECHSLSVVELSHNCIEDPDVVQVFSQMQNIVSHRTVAGKGSEFSLACDQFDGKSSFEKCQRLSTNTDTRMCKFEEETHRSNLMKCRLSR